MSESYQVSSLDPKVLATVNKELNRREEEQRRLYGYLEQLQNFTRELPSKYRQRMTDNLLADLARSLLDGTVFQIVQGMSDLQKLEEENLLKERKRLINKFNDDRKTLLEIHAESIHKCAQVPTRLKITEQQNINELQAFEDKRREEIINKDKQIIARLDNKVSNQQQTLNKAGAAGFFPTADPDEIRLQMFLIEFILRLSSHNDS